MSPRPEIPAAAFPHDCPEGSRCSLLTSLLTFLFIRRLTHPLELDSHTSNCAICPRHLCFPRIEEISPMANPPAY
jgi:hypothetical protein